MYGRSPGPHSWTARNGNALPLRISRSSRMCSVRSLVSMSHAFRTVWPMTRALRASPSFPSWMASRTHWTCTSRRPTSNPLPCCVSMHCGTQALSCARSSAQTWAGSTLDTPRSRRACSRGTVRWCPSVRLSWTTRCLTACLKASLASRCARPRTSPISRISSARADSHWRLCSNTPLNVEIR